SGGVEWKDGRVDGTSHRPRLSLRNGGKQENLNSVSWVPDLRWPCSIALPRSVTFYLAGARFPAEISMLTQPSNPKGTNFYMTKKFMCLVAILSAMGAMMLFAQQGTTKAGEGTLTLEK